MKRVWIKKADIVYVPFYKQKLKVTMLLVIVMAIVFFSYQMYCMRQLNKSILFFDKSGTDDHSRHSQKGSSRFQGVAELMDRRSNRTDTASGLPRGIHVNNAGHYSQFNATNFKCIQSGREISFDRVNDEYCDCPEDGSDEPSTTACANGRFYCKHSMRAVPSSRINDGICDCCDLSDEWLSRDIKCNSMTCK